MNIHNINIRREIPADYRVVEALTREAFWASWEKNKTICNEHLLVKLFTMLFMMLFTMTTS